MLIEASIQDLLTSTNQIETKARQHIAYKVQFPQGYQVLKVGKDLVFQGHASTGHNPKIRQVNFQEDEDTGTLVATTTHETLSVVPMEMNSPVYVTCDCEDFVYRFAFTNHQQGVLFGRITSPKIPKTNRPTSNLGQIGICKHLIKFVELLASEKLIDR